MDVAPAGRVLSHSLGDNSITTMGAPLLIGSRKRVI